MNNNCVFTAVILKVFNGDSNFCSKHRLWVHVRTALFYYMECEGVNIARACFPDAWSFLGLQNYYIVPYLGNGSILCSDSTDFGPALSAYVSVKHGSSVMEGLM